VAARAEQPSREATEQFLTAMLSEHVKGIVGGVSDQNWISSHFEGCVMHVETSAADPGAATETTAETSAKIGHTAAQSDLKDVIDVSTADRDHIAITGASTAVTFTRKGTTREQQGSMTIILDNPDITRRVATALGDMVRLCGGTPGLYK
jgi:hypothetical protein